MEQGTSAISLAQRVGLLVDVQHLFYAGKNLLQSKVEYGKLLRGAVAGRQLVRALAYVIQRGDVQQGGFQTALQNSGYELRIREIKAQAQSSGPGNFPKASWAAGMAVEALLLAERLDVLILATGDEDLLPAIPAIKAKGCSVEILGFEQATAPTLLRAADRFVRISDEWIFKEQKFTAPPAAARQNVRRGFEGLPNDAELDAEAAELERRSSAYE